MQTVNKIFGLLEKVAYFESLLSGTDFGIEKRAATVSKALMKLLRTRNAGILKLMKKNPGMSRMAARDLWMRNNGLQRLANGKIVAREGKLSKAVANRANRYLGAMKQNKALSGEIKNLKNLNPKEVTSKRLRDLSQRFNLSEANGDYILAQPGKFRPTTTVNWTDTKGVLSPAGTQHTSTVADGWSQSPFKLNRKPSAIMRRLRRKPAPDTPPNNPPKPDTPPNNPPKPDTPPNNPPKPDTPPNNPPKPNPDPNNPPKPDTPPNPDPNNPEAAGWLGSNWWKYGLAGAGGFIAGRMTAPEPENPYGWTYGNGQTGTTASTGYM